MSSVTSIHNPLQIISQIPVEYPYIYWFLIISKFSMQEFSLIIKNLSCLCCHYWQYQQNFNAHAIVYWGYNIYTVTIHYINFIIPTSIQTYYMHPTIFLLHSSVGCQKLSLGWHFLQLNWGPEIIILRFFLLFLNSYLKIFFILGIHGLIVLCYL